jgi:hypothetical protein
MYERLRVKNRYSSQIVMEAELFRRIFKEYSNVKFQEHPSSGGRVAPCGQTDTTRVIIAFRNLRTRMKSCRLSFSPAEVGTMTVMRYIR